MSIIAPHVSAPEEDKKNNSVFEEEKTTTSDSPKSPTIKNKRMWLTQSKKAEDPKSIAILLSTEINAWAGRVYQSWNQYVLTLNAVPHNISNLYCEDYNQCISSAFGRYIQRAVSVAATFPNYIDKDVATEHKALMKVLRASVLKNKANPIPVFIINRIL